MQGEVGTAAANILWSLSERLVAASNAAGRGGAVVLAGKAGAWRPVADGEQFGPGNSFSMNLTTGARYVSVPLDEPQDHCEELVATAERGRAEALVTEFIEENDRAGGAAGAHPGAVSTKSRL